MKTCKVIPSAGETSVNRSVPSQVLLGPDSLCLWSLVLESLVSSSAFCLSGESLCTVTSVHEYVPSLSFGVSGCSQVVFKFSSFSTPL